jgi:hypothetical protein
VIFRWWRDRREAQRRRLLQSIEDDAAKEGAPALSPLESDRRIIRAYWAGRQRYWEERCRACEKRGRCSDWPNCGCAPLYLPARELA